MKHLVQALKDNGWFVTLNHALWPELSSVRSRQCYEATRVVDQHIQMRLK